MNPTVLLADDEVRSLDAMRRTLEEDFDILTATDVDAVLCDQRMPGTTGVQFLRDARERCGTAWRGRTSSCAAAA